MRDVYQRFQATRARGIPNIPKVTTAMKKVIVELAIAGLTSGAIARHLKQDFGVDITSRAVRFWRVKLGDRIRKQISGILDTAYATQPLASLEVRLKLYARTIREEHTKDAKYRDGKVINDALKNAAEDIRNLELIRLKAEELEIKSGTGKTEGNDFISFIEKIEKRLVISKANEIKNDELAKLAGWDDDDEDEAKPTA